MTNIFTEKLTIFNIGSYSEHVSFIETQQVKNGVECDIYKFTDDDTKDLAIVRVQTGCKTPLQKILSGTTTIEGFISGSGTLSVNDGSNTKTHTFTNDDTGKEIVLGVGQTMQWTAENSLVFYEICSPPYEDGRFQNLSE